MRDFNRLKRKAKITKQSDLLEEQLARQALTAKNEDEPRFKPHHFGMKTYQEVLHKMMCEKQLIKLEDIYWLEQGATLEQIRQPEFWKEHVRGVYIDDFLGDRKPCHYLHLGKSLEASSARNNEKKSSKYIEIARILIGASILFCIVYPPAFKVVVKVLSGEWL